MMAERRLRDVTPASRRTPYSVRGYNVRYQRGTPAIAPSANLRRAVRIGRKTVDRLRKMCCNLLLPDDDSNEYDT